MKLSIIIPVYNTAEYLRTCLDSIFVQDLSSDEYEVIVINDGSTDDSREILKDYQIRHNNIMVINQQNQGVSIARNKGLEIAKGEYITFVDSDDSLYENVLKSIITKFIKENLDLLYLGMQAFSEEKKLLDLNFDVGKSDVVQNGISHPRRTFPPTLYKKNIIGLIRFSPHISIGEDTVFNAMVQTNAERCSFFPSNYYKYTIRLNSASKNGVSDKAFHGFINALKEISQFEKTNSSKSESENKYYSDLYTTFITRIVELNIIPLWDKKKYNYLKALLNELNNTNELINISSRYKYIHKSFIAFKYYQKYLEFKSTIYKRFFSKNKQC
ncbi:MAG: glycosyltransferase [Flavobacteriaceae bacterium]|nr:glycosyltransferase [Flavobacteriaceae bacterium]